MAFYNLDSLSAEVISNDGYSVNQYDSSDVFAFDITNSNHNIGLNLHNLSADADLTLYFDSNNNGVLDSFDSWVASSAEWNTTDDTIDISASNYGTGTYFARVNQFSSGHITYDLDLSATYDVGSLAETPIEKTSYNVSDADPTDVFEFTLDYSQAIHLNLNNISGGDADLSLYQDNGNGVFDSGDTFVTGSFNYGEQDDLIDYRAEAGTYFAEVSRYSGSQVTYDLDMSATYSSGSNLVGGEIEIGLVTSDVYETGWVGNTDSVDTYAFSVGYYSGVDISLTNMVADADIQLIQDHNNNGLIDTGEVIGSSTNGSNANEMISSIEQSGSYLLQVNQFASNETGYTLQLNHYNTYYA